MSGFSEMDPPQLVRWPSCLAKWITTLNSKCNKPKPEKCSTNLLSSLVKSLCPRVITESRPHLVHFFQTRSCQVFNSWPFLHPASVIILNSSDLCLLQHDFRDPYSICALVWIRLRHSVSPRKLSVVFVIPSQQFGASLQYFAVCEVVRVFLWSNVILTFRF